ncbi:hypothetical protein K040078D81_24650 [Blautia hominis]|uniref:Uncharacterized protein n=1 Tax=Blautia hominis TaxID=2025493 RepID=A0ABQ0BA67_9FIRM
MICHLNEFYKEYMTTALYEIMHEGVNNAEGNIEFTGYKYGGVEKNIGESVLLRNMRA